MLNLLKQIFTADELLEGNFGIEREALRVNVLGELSYKPHPDIFGDKLKNQYISTDFSESQIEVKTPIMNSVEDLYYFNNSLYNIVSMEIKDEYLWPQSMPCSIPDEAMIPIAKYTDDIEGREASLYREDLKRKYGAKKQLISGIHYNFSFKDEFMLKLYKNQMSENVDKNNYQHFKNKVYLKLSRNYLRYRWLIIYLLGASGVVHESYKKNASTDVISYRNSEWGYKNNTELYPDYSSLEAYIESINQFISTKKISGFKELYSALRIKPKATSNLLTSLLSDGINHLEYRSIDINPFEKGGISLDDLYFLQLFNLFLLVSEESDYEKWQEEAEENQKLISSFGGKPKLMLMKDGKPISMEEWAVELILAIEKINNVLGLGKKEIVLLLIEKVKNYKLTYAYKIQKKVEEEGYINAHINLAQGYYELAYSNRYNLEGFESLELSTQIVIKEAIKRGIEVDVLDKSENFIRLISDEKIEYIKQATKTSKDNYVTVLIMENKSVTKKILGEHNIKVPEGIEVSSKSDAEKLLKKLEYSSLVVKPKTTNFGYGISIFPDGTDDENFIKALDIAFKYDQTILVEEFIKGNEYRFLIINGKVIGVVQRIPANIKGDGEKTISELVQIKNQDPLRGYNHTTPLEKIIFDDHTALYLQQQNKDIHYVPKQGEVVYLRANSNISTGGDSIDCTDAIPQKFKKIAIDSANLVGANICGVDMIIEDYNDENTSYAVIELNFNPTLYIHAYPYKGMEREIGAEVLRALDFIK